MKIHEICVKTPNNRWSVIDAAVSRQKAMILAKSYAIGMSKTTTIRNTMEPSTLSIHCILSREFAGINYNFKQDVIVVTNKRIMVALLNRIAELGFTGTLSVNEHNIFIKVTK
jgi:hypothetical protein